jgi:nitroreductase
MSGEAVTKEELFTLFDAARWAASSYNNQPERFIYATRNSANWDKFLNLMVEFNQMWAKNAGALVVVVSKNSFDHNGQFMNTHSFDTGAACANMALQGSSMGLVVHGMPALIMIKLKESFLSLKVIQSKLCLL